jgi:multidrug efflux pump subunit AcrA (membrane-fusion protein)
MKNVVIFLLVLCTLFAGYFAVRGHWRVSLTELEGRTHKLTRGELTVPINATGEVRPFRRVEIKSEASGEVILIAKRPGDRVRAGDLLIRLQPDDEQRSVDRARLELDVAEARLETARINLEQARTVDLASASARIAQLEPSLELAQFRKNKFDAMTDIQTNPEERLQWDTTVRSTKAQLDAARADFDRVKLSVKRYEQEVKQAQANQEAAKTTLADAEKRLSKTDIVAPISGIVGDIRTQVGEVIQGGKTTLTGGTVLAVVLDMERLIVRAEVDEADIGRIQAIAPPWARPGNDGSTPMPEDLAEAAQKSQPLPTITVESFRDKEFQGIIQRIFPEPKTISSSSIVTYFVEVVLTGDNQNILLPGMRADVNFISERVENVVLCPNEAVREGPAGGFGVYVPKPGADPMERVTEFVPCKFGLDNGNLSEVRCEALKEGMTVYTKLPIPRDQDRQASRKPR